MLSKWTEKFGAVIPIQNERCTCKLLCTLHSMNGRYIFSLHTAFWKWFVVGFLPHKRAGVEVIVDDPQTWEMGYSVRLNHWLPYTLASHTRAVANSNCLVVF